MEKRNVKTWLLKTKDGNIVVGQKPNVPFYVAAAGYLVWIVFSGNVAETGLWIGRIALLYWAGLEVTQGVNNFRRILGGVVFVGLLFSVALDFIIT